MAGTIAAAAQVAPTVAPQVKVPFIETKEANGQTLDGMMTHVAKQFLIQLYRQTLSANRIIPTQCTNATNVYTLTMLGSQPTYTAYATFDTFGFVASATSTGLITMLVTTKNGSLATLKAFKTNGSAQATTGDVTINLQYFATYVDSLDSGNGGFVLR